MSEKQGSGVYDFQTIEEKWQDYWEANETFRAEFDPARPKYYVLRLFQNPTHFGYAPRITKHTQTPALPELDHRRPDGGAACIAGAVRENEDGHV